jgi:hypothetical protein
MDVDLNEWFENVHIPDLLKLPGYLRAKLFKMADYQKPPTVVPPTHRYLTIYELTGDPRQIIEATVAARVEGSITRNPSLAPDSYGWLYTQISDRRVPLRPG